jgi:hypothetical protein
MPRRIGQTFIMLVRASHIPRVSGRFPISLIPVSNIIFASRLRNRVVFADTDAVPALETRQGDLVQNEIEADLVHQVRSEVFVPLSWTQI